MRAAFLGLGGNIGDPAATMGEALRHLDERPDTSVVAASRLYRTPPWGKTDQPWFVNACATIETDLQPLGLLDAVMEVERLLKRERVKRWGPRTIDIDILAIDDIALRSERLTLPHPRVQERAFVLTPLAELAPELVIGGCTVAEWLVEMRDDAVRPLGEDRDWWRSAPSG